ncbi:KR-domain-containing protein [Colletotrichum sublineola]|nr:KR-domain-containing protein [Colletotrichum sublineola]
MDWQGPSIVVKTGCSASLVALDMACHSLRAGECSSAVVLGVNLITCPLMTLLYTAQGLLSPSGRCKTFDAAADGYGRGEAVNAVFLRRLSNAKQDGDPIRAFGDTAWIECHGTGTAVGDPIELRSIANIFRRQGIIVGSVKPNVGHSEGAAGLTGLIKAVLSLEHETIPPNIFFNTPNPLIPWDEARLRVPIDALPWPVDRKKRVSVNSFGVGGSNAHVILEADTIVDRPEAGHQAKSDYDLVLIDGAVTLNGMCSVLTPAQCVSLLSRGGWLLVNGSDEESQRKLEELGLGVVHRASSASRNGGFSIARTLNNDKPKARRSRHAIVLATPALDKLARALQSSLEEGGISSEIRHCSSKNQGLSTSEDEDTIVVSMLYLERSPEAMALTPGSFRVFIDKLLAARGPIVWVLPPLQLGSTGSASLCRQPDAACLIGLARTAHTENPSLSLTTVEMDVGSTSISDASSALSRIILRLSQARFGLEDGLDMDRELGITSEGTVLIPRMTWFSLGDAAAAAELSNHTDRGGKDGIIFRNDASYLIVGGFGGLGRSLCLWMAARGARHLVIFSRSAAAKPDASMLFFIEQLKISFGCTVVRVGGSAENHSDVERAVNAADRASSRGLVGVVHMPMVLRDRPMRDMTWDDWVAAVDPKVHGAWNLHNAMDSRRAKLDFFVLFSSVSSIIGQHGQANYNAANTFLDAFALYRRGLGLPASVLNLGIVGDVGAVTRDATLAAQFRKAGYVFIEEDTVLRAVGIAMSPLAPPQLVLGLTQDPQADNTTRAVVWKRDPRMAKAFNSGSGLGAVEDHGGAGSSVASAMRREIREIISWASEEPIGLVTEARRTSLAFCLGRALHEVLARPLETPLLTRRINSLGLDSFAAVELTSWIHQHFIIQVSTMESNTDISLMQLADLVMNRMVEKHKQAAQLATYARENS